MRALHREIQQDRRTTRPPTRILQTLKSQLVRLQYRVILLARVGPPPRWPSIALSSMRSVPRDADAAETAMRQHLSISGNLLMQAIEDATGTAVILDAVRSLHLTQPDGVHMCSQRKPASSSPAHPGDFVWRAGGAIALHAKKGYRMKIVCMSFGERGESQFAWKEAGATAGEASRPAARMKPNAQPPCSAPRSNSSMPAIIRSSSPKRISTAWSISIANSIRLSCWTHALKDPYNFDHPNAAHFAQETRVVAQAMGHKPGAKYQYSAPPVYLFEPHQPEQCNYKPDLILKIDDVWETKYKAFQILAAQKHLWHYYERVALNRGIQGSRNTGILMTYGEAYQTLSPRIVTDTLG